MRLNQITTDPATAPWLVRAVIAPGEDSVAVHEEGLESGDGLSLSGCNTQEAPSC